MIKQFSEDETEAGKQQKVTVVNYVVPEIPEVSCEEEPKCCECCCGCGYRGVAITLAVLYGIGLLFDRGIVCIYQLSVFIFYCVMACSEPTSGLAYTAAIFNNVRAVLDYVSAGFFYLVGIGVMFLASDDVKQYILLKAIWYGSFYGITSIDGDMAGCACICIVIGVVITLEGCFFQYIAGRFYAFEEYFKKKQEEKDGVALGRNL